MIGMLHKILRPFMLRRLKADVEKSLPPKSEMMIFTGMTPVQKELYKKILRREVDLVNGEAASSKNALLNIVMQLRKCCNHPYLFEGVEDRTLDPLGDHLVTSCGKMALLDKLLAKLFKRGHRVLIFSQMTRMLGKGKHRPPPNQYKTLTKLTHPCLLLACQIFWRTIC